MSLGGSQFTLYSIYTDTAKTIKRKHLEKWLFILPCSKKEHKYHKSSQGGQGPLFVLFVFVPYLYFFKLVHYMIDHDVQSLAHKSYIHFFDTLVFMFFLDLVI